MEKKSITSKKNRRNHMDPMSMHILKKRIMVMKTGEIIRSAIREYYEEIGLPEPNWRCNRNDQWFIDYCEGLKGN